MDELSIAGIAVVHEVRRPAVGKLSPEDRMHRWSILDDHLLESFFDEGH